jgi:hypothetical protein
MNREIDVEQIKNEVNDFIKKNIILLKNFIKDNI